MLKTLTTLSVLMTVSTYSFSAPLPDPRNFPVGKPTLACVEKAAKDHNVPFVMLLGVNSIERGNTGQNVGNKNGSLDTGAFQINSIHFARAAKLKASHSDLASRGCYNAQFAAMLLSEALNQRSKQHLDVYTRGAGYHSWTPKYNNIYRTKLVRYTGEWQRWLDTNAPTQQYNNPQAQPVSYNKTPNPFTSGFIGNTHNSYQ